MKLILKETPIIFKKEQVDEIIYKNYWERTGTQYCYLRQIKSALDSLTFSQIKGSLEFYIDTSAPVNYTTNSYIIGSRGMNIAFMISNSKVPAYYCGSDSESTANFNELSVSKDYEFVFNNVTGDITLNNETESIVHSSPKSKISTLCLFAKLDTTNYDSSPSKIATYTSIKFKRLRLYDADNNAIADIRPALVNNIPCLYDSINNSEIYSEDNTPMILSD